MEPREKAALLPESPGVYLFKDAGGTVLYVGKARSLRNRVRLGNWQLGGDYGHFRLVQVTGAFRANTGRAVVNYRF